MPWLKLNLIGLLALALTGCHGIHPSSATTPSGAYPIGLYSVLSTNDFPSVHAAGFNLVTGSTSRGYLDAAQANGLRVLMRPDTEAGDKFDAVRARETVRLFDSHPAVWAWYLVDEPDLNLVSPEDVWRARDCVKNAGARKPTAITLFNGHSVPLYTSAPDIVMIDRYPIPWLPLANFGQHVGLARAAVAEGKPLVAIVQAFDWSTDRKSLRDEPDTPLRAPTYEEMRCMTYEALARGANGLFYFAYDTGSWRMSDHPQTWNDLKRVVADVNERLPLFQAAHLWWPSEQLFEDPKRRYNAALESSITLSLLRVHPGNRAVPDGDYVLAVNNTDQTHVFHFVLPASGKAGRKQVAALGEGRDAPVADDWVRDEFAPYAVHVYRLSD